MATNQGAWLMSKQARPFTIDKAPMPQPKAGEVIIRNYAVAMNPVDAGIQNMGMIWEEYPAVIGCDIAGEVFQVGPEVTGFQKGDRVIACVEDGAFQLFTAADVRLVAKLPDQISYAQGAVLPLALTTAASLFHPNNLGLPPPQLGSEPNVQTVLVWGGASAVGSCAIQLLKAAGFDVITTASSTNFQYCKELGASAVFDYKEETIVETIVEAFEGRQFAGAFSAIFIPPTVIRDCAQIADKLGKDEKTRVVSTVLPSSMPYTDAVPEGVRIAYCDGTVEFTPDSKMTKLLGVTATPNDVGPAIWGRWITRALESGLLQCKPEPEVVGSGLEAIQGAVDRIGAGVSAKKIVVELP